MIFEFTLQTELEGFYNITAKAAQAVREFCTKTGESEAECLVFCPHTSAGITINENNDPDVVHDILLGLEKAFPDCKGFRHAEENSTAHLKSSCVGVSARLIVQDGKLLLGTWQAIYFCEFDGPRTRHFYVQVR